MTTFGFPSLYEDSKNKESKRELNIVAVLNCMNELLVLQRKNLLAQENVETQNLKLGSDMDHLQNCYAKLKVIVQYMLIFFNPVMLFATLKFSHQTDFRVLQSGK